MLLNLPFSIPLVIKRLLYSYMLMLFVPLSVHTYITATYCSLCRERSQNCHKLCHRDSTRLPSRRVHKVNKFFTTTEYTIICLHECIAEYSVCVIPRYLAYVAIFSLIAFLLLVSIAYPVYHSIRATIPVSIYERKVDTSFSSIVCPNCSCLFVSDRLNIDHPTGVHETLFCPSCLHFIAGIL